MSTEQPDCTYDPEMQVGDETQLSMQHVRQSTVPLSQLRTRPLLRKKDSSQPGSTDQAVPDAEGAMPVIQRFGDQSRKVKCDVALSDVRGARVLSLADLLGVSNVRRLEYDPGYNDMGAFTPSGCTPQAIKDMNIAFYLFRIHQPLVAHGARYRILMNWLRRRWNTAERLPCKRGVRSPIGDNLLRKAADVILEGNKNITVGRLHIPDAVKERHNASSPDALMLMECLAQWRPCQPSKPVSGELDFRNNGLLLDALKDKGVGPSKYRDLLVRLLKMDATSR